MVDIDVIRRQLTDSVPFSRVLGVQVVSAGIGQAEAVLPESPERRNHVGTVHAVAQFGLGETTSGMVLVATFTDLQAQGFVPVVADVAIHYLKAARGDLHSRASLSSEEQNRIREEVGRTGRSRVTIPVILTDDSGTSTTEFEITWVLLKPRE
jgi:acyl-coenzyme A thioesterase PaaI-like protein